MRPLSLLQCATTMTMLAIAAPAVATPATSCTPGSERQRVTVAIAAPGTQSVISLVVSLDYDRSRLAVPSGGDAALRKRVSARGTGVILAPDANQDGIRLVIAKAGGLPSGQLADLELDRCSGAPAPQAHDVTCHVASCAGSGGPIEGCTCAVTLP